MARKKKRKYMSGTYEIKNWDRYAGTVAPKFRSSFELAVFKYFDNKKAVIKWGAEIIVVPYYNPIKQRKARYMVDIYVEYYNVDGRKIVEIIEIKPLAQCKEPVKTFRKKQTTFDEEVRTWAQNKAKWEAATKYAQERGWGFRIITEKDIFR